jgi:eukaryotic-like serine/threonine-protein kinase
MKPENVFINKNIHKIGDFGFAREASKFQSSLGTCLYMSPEFYTGEPKNEKVDVWALGVIAY